MTINDLWDEMGSLSGDEAMHVLTRIFDIYEEEVKRNPNSPEAGAFFKHMENAISQISQCNSNRR